MARAHADKSECEPVTLAQVKKDPIRAVEDAIALLGLGANAAQAVLIRTAFSKLRKLAGVPEEVKFSHIRDGAYTAAIDGGADLTHARLLAGHATGITDAYVRRKPTMVQDACQAIYKHYFGEIAEAATAGSNAPRADADEGQKHHPDGLESPNLLYCGGQCRRLPPLQWRLLQFMWERDKARVEDVVAEVWEHGASDGSLSPTISKLNTNLETIGALKLADLSVKNGWVLNKAVTSP